MCTQCHGVLDSPRKPRSEYTISCIAFALLWPLFFHLFFAHFRVPRVNHTDYIKVRV